MRILLIGEYSGLNRYLKDGLIKLGHDAQLAAMGDGWKNIPGADYRLWELENGNSIKSFFSRLSSSREIVKSVFCNYDVVHFIHPIPFSTLINYSNISNIAKQNNKVLSVEAAGYDYALIKAYKNDKFEYYIDNFLLETPYTNSLIRGTFFCQLERAVLNKMDIIIPGLYEYSVGYENNPKLHSVIPMPVNTDLLEYSENKVSDKVVFFHGLNRENAKGTKYIREAFEIINKKYPNQVETIIEGHLPFEKYVNLINKVNVMVDQCCCYGYGINALISMAKGKVLMTGAHDKTLEAFGLKREECPIFNAIPDVKQLVEQMSYIIEHKELIPEWGLKSRKYVENLHSCEKIAQQYIDAWKSTGKL
ncbi:glycosyltransferase [Enterococcus cecorum]|uniref:glycosyltransferase n=2 Tax=Enterococcus cecorum TaxID=44008 RepID=UPI000AC28CA0|nr:glycosyltransferase [Enterococcus cecorum]CAI3507152.1 hypothetical protein CIRMBP1309_02113 [Enterococcus cecorum]